MDVDMTTKGTRGEEVVQKNWWRRFGREDYHRPACDWRLECRLLREPTAIQHWQDTRALLRLQCTCELVFAKRHRSTQLEKVSSLTFCGITRQNNLGPHAG